MKIGELAAIEASEVNRRTMKRNILKNCRGCRLFLTGVVWTAVLMTASGCGRREAEFLKNAEGSSLIAEDIEDVSEDSDDAAKDSEMTSEGGNDEKASADKNSGQKKSVLTDQSVDEKKDVLSEEVINLNVAGNDSGQTEDVSSGNEMSVPEMIYVDVCGAVMSPGVYELDADSRVFQAITAAGGLLPEAAGEYVNKAESLYDGQQIYIPTREEAESTPSLKSPLEKNADDGSVKTHTEGQDAVGMHTEKESDAKAQAESLNGKINLNTADEDALTTLTGIGASKAQAILTYREENGGFSAIEEILNVPGIKEGTFVKIKDHITAE